MLHVSTASMETDVVVVDVLLNACAISCKDPQSWAMLAKIHPNGCSIDCHEEAGSRLQFKIRYREGRYSSPLITLVSRAEKQCHDHP